MFGADRSRLGPIPQRAEGAPRWHECESAGNFAMALHSDTRQSSIACYRTSGRCASDSVRHDWVLYFGENSTSEISAGGSLLTSVASDTLQHLPNGVKVALLEVVLPASLMPLELGTIDFGAAKRGGAVDPEIVEGVAESGS